MTPAGPRGGTDLEWRVFGVFDPDGVEPEFSYTTGLHDLGLPELHVWANPPDGLDPGADWMLSMNDRGLLLNETAQRLFDGELAIGDSWTEELDAGFTTVSYRLSGPVEPASVDAFHTHPDATVVEVRWELRRATPPMQPSTIADEWRHRCRSWAAEIAACADDRSAWLGHAPVPGVGQVPAAVDAIDPDGAVRTLLEEVRRAVGTHTEIRALLSSTYYVNRQLMSAGAMLEAAARATGRLHELASVKDVAAHDAAALRAAWVPDGDREWGAAYQEQVGLALSMAYGALVVGDVVPDEVMSGAGGLVYALCDPERAVARFAGAFGTGSDALAAIVAPVGEELLDAVIEGVVSAAHAGRGVPFFDDEAEAYRRLVAAGFIDP